jgi:hypothetical protein
VASRTPTARKRVAAPIIGGIVSSMTRIPMYVDPQTM